MRQVNIVGTSPPSQPSRKIETLQAPPDIAPANVTLRTASETSLWLRWVVSFYWWEFHRDVLASKCTIICHSFGGTDVCFLYTWIRHFTFHFGKSCLW